MMFYLPKYIILTYGENRFTIEGKLFENNDIDFNILANKLNLNIILPFIKDDFIINKGHIYGNAQIFGNISNIQWLGTMSMKNISITNKYLGTQLDFSTIIALNKNHLMIAKTKITDSENNIAHFWLNATHNNFKNINYTLEFTTNNFILLDSESRNSSGVYGKIYASGQGVITGNDDKIAIDAELTTMSNSDLFFVTIEEDLDENNNYIFFNDTKNITKINKETTDFKTKGKYNFYIENVYGKEFIVDKNSKITWDGSPFDANLSLVATYKIKKANIYNLTLDEKYLNTNLPVNCKILIYNKLMKPDITFDVKIPEKGNISHEMINGLPQDEINKQFLSLLLFGSFIPLPGLVKEQEIESNYEIKVGEILASQLGSLVSMLSNNFEVDFKYNQKGVKNSDEIEVDFSTSILDDRILINGNVAKGEYRNSTNNIVGDFEAEIKLSKEGKLKLKVFNKSNRNITDDKGPYTQGISIFYKRNFNNIFKSKKKKYKEEKQNGK